MLLLLAPGIASSSDFARSGVAGVAKVPSTVALTVTTPTTVFFGEAIDGLAQVTANDGSTVTGTVTFYDGTTSFCTLTLLDGASCSAGAATGFVAGVHVFTAVYLGDATHDGATSNAVSVTVEQDTTTTVISSSANPVAAGGGVVYRATVIGAHGPARGSVTFLDGTASMGSAVVDTNGAAELSVVMMSPGAHAITAMYAGSANSAGSTSAVLSEMVQAPLPGGFTISVDSITVVAGETAVVPVKVAMGSGSAKAVSLSCSGLPDEATCSFLPGTVSADGETATLKITTAGPRDCGSSVPYGAPKRSAGVPVAGPVLAGLLVVFVPGRRRVVARLLAAFFVVAAMGAMTGCGMGNCTDLGTRPGSYRITVMGSEGGTLVSQRVKLVVKP